VWARLRLVEGRSNAELWEFVGARGQTLLTVGSSPSCSWLVQEAGVAPIHFSLHWDGSSLSIADTHGVGRLQLDGAPVGPTWRRISGRARIDFGNAAMVVETSGSQSPLPAEIPARPVPKGTLLGVAPASTRQQAQTPIMASVPSKPAAAVEPSATSDASRKTDPGPGAFVPKRPDSTRAPKPTLLGMAQTPVPPSNQAAPPSTTPPPQRVGGASLAGSDERTIKGFPTVAAPAKPQVVVATSVEPREVQPAVGQAPSPSQPQPSPSSVPAAAMVVTGREASGRHPRHRPESGYPEFASRARGIPDSVLVLSPIGGGAAEQPVFVERPSYAARRNRQLPSWRAIVLGIVGTLVTYGCWLYLLHRL